VGSSYLYRFTEVVFDAFVKYEQANHIFEYQKSLK
jgi:hypothetical protein